MKKMLSTLIVLILALPMSLQAGGVGLYIPYSSGMNVDVEYDESGNTYDYDLKSKAEIAIALDTNMGKDKMFAYRIALELLHPQGETWGVGDALLRR